jgi:hypothetical protein
MTGENTNATKSQRDAILAHLQEGRTLTALEALDRFGCNRLAARIGELKAAGWDIRSRMIEIDSGKHVAEYRLASGGRRSGVLSVKPEGPDVMSKAAAEAPGGQRGLFDVPKALEEDPFAAWDRRRAFETGARR